MKDATINTTKNKIKINTIEPTSPHLRNGGELVRNKKIRVICAMSGGVDSSVAAALLKKQGYDVIGVFMKLWSDASDQKNVKENICCSLEASSAARAVAAKLDIPFYVIDLQKEFKKAVVDNFVKECEAGRTPNPCVVCNRDIKGEVLMRKMEEMDGDHLAMGHYAKIVQKSNLKNQNDNSKFKNKIISYQLYKGKDETKDQSYFLWTLTQDKLAKMLFPVDDLTKVEVRKLAKKFALPTAERRESQGICFIPDRDVSGFLHHHAKKLIKSGEICSIDGEILGTHNGLINYTIGQREGLGLGGPKAYYVVKLDCQNNRLIVGDEGDLYSDSLVVSDVNWINQNVVELLNGSIAKSDYKQLNNRTIEQFNIEATIRYGHKAEKCRLKVVDKKQIVVNFIKPQRAITPGQSIVFYQNNELIGGGIIN